MDVQPTSAGALGKFAAILVKLNGVIASMNPSNGLISVVFSDSSAKFSFLTRSTVQTRETIVWEDGKEYPLYKLDISSASHPFYTGTQRLVDTEGRVDRFLRKYNLKKEKTN